jgi:hypothetical protein
MTSGAVGRAASPSQPLAASWWLAGIVLLTVLGFQRAVMHRVDPMDAAHASHGIAAIGWSVILVAQSWLAQRRRREAHRVVGAIGVVFAIALVTTSWPMLQLLASGAMSDLRFRAVGLRLLAMDCLLLIMFVLLFALAIAYVRRPVTHARAMAATGLLALPAGLGRLFMRVAAVDPVQGSYLALASATLVLVLLIVADRRAGTNDWVLPTVLGATVAVALLIGPMADAAWFGAWAEMLAPR